MEIDLAQFEYPRERNETNNRRVGNPRFIKVRIVGISNNE